MGKGRTPGPSGTPTPLPNISTVNRGPLGSKRTAFDQWTSGVRGPLGLLEGIDEFLAGFFRSLGITDVAGFVALQAKYNRSFGLAIALGKWNGQPCMHEFKVKHHRDGFWGSMKHTSTLQLRRPPKYLKGTKRECYLRGDIVLTQEKTLREVNAFLKGASLQDNRPGRLKVFQYLLSDGAQKRYKLGYLIEDIKPNGDGSGWVDVQPVVFFGKYPKPMGFGFGMGVGGIFYNNPHVDFNSQWGHRAIFESDLHHFVMGFSSFVAEYGAGAVKSLGAKLAKELLGRYVEREVKDEIRKRLAKALPVASMAFAVAYLKEIDEGITREFEQQAGRGSVQRALENEVTLKKAAEKGIGAFLASILSEVTGEAINSLLPHEVVDGMSIRLTRWLLHLKGKFLINATTKLINHHADRIDPETGKINRQLDQQATQSYVQSLTQVFKDIVDEVADVLSEYALG